MYMYMYFFFFVLLNKIVQTRWLGVSKILRHFLHFILTSVLLIACSKGYSQTIFYLSIDQTSVYLLLLWLMTVNNVEANLRRSLVQCSIVYTSHSCLLYLPSLLGDCYQRKNAKTSGRS